MGLDLIPLLNDLDQRLGLANIFEIGGDHRIQRLIDKHFYIAEPLNDQRRLFVVDMHHDRQR